MPRPLIGLTTSRFKNSKSVPMVGTTEAYVQAILAAGGIPVLIPSGMDNESALELAASLDGILFTGGGDIDIRRFNGRPHDRVSGVDAGRDELEITLARWCMENGQPFLGICRGAQLINVTLGGSLYTDVGDQFGNRIHHDGSSLQDRTKLVHTVQLDTDSRLAEILGTTSFRVNSLHHQAVDLPAASLAVTGHSEDGLVESLELHGHHFGILVQWHPEWLTDQEPMRRLFRAFVEAAGQHA